MPLRNTQDLPPAGKIAAVDVGEKTYGLAVCDGLRLSATPRPTLKRTKWADDSPQFAAFLKAEAIVAVVVGLPLTLGGERGPSAERALSFANLVEQTFNLPVLMWDERLTTVAAENALFEQRTGRQTRASRKQVKQQVDGVAAALLLQTVLENLRLKK